MPSNTLKKSKTSQLRTLEVIIPTLNCGQVLHKSLKSIVSQNLYKIKLTITIVDGGSVDNTIEVANEYKCHILQNPLKTAEAGKAIGIKASKSEYICLIDSDNILPNRKYFQKLLQPFEYDDEIVCSENSFFTYRSNSGFIERYSSLIGANDPFSLVTGNYDKYSILHPHQWNNYHLPLIKYPGFQIATITNPTKIPTIGANGTIFKRDFINYNNSYFFDVDAIASQVVIKPVKVAKVNIGIIHTFCESSISKFFRKQLRRSRDLYYYRQFRQNNALNNTTSVYYWIFYCITVVPMVYHILLGYIRKPDIAWLFHPIACIITSFTYGYSTILFLFGNVAKYDRSNWRQ